ncbi:D-galactarate dehydratase [Lentibacter algarum]|nr:D-galactarate dehydratase [Lentibacter algarum]
MRPKARPDGLNTTPAKRPPANATTAAQFDTTSAAEKTAAVEAAKEATQKGEGKALGVTVASLGDPAQPGLWIKTPLVKTAAKGRVVYGKNGKAVELDLIPLDGPASAGSRMSLAALRVVEAPLTDLSEVQVFVN